MDHNSIPKTGRIGRFAKIVNESTEEEIFLKIMEGSREYVKYSPVEKAWWWNHSVDRLESELGTDRAVKIMRCCGAKCCGTGQRKTARRLMAESKSVNEFLHRLRTHEVKEGELDYKLVDEKTIIAIHNRCFCGQVKHTEKRFSNDTYCQCSVEFNTQFFQAALDKPVDVKLNRSILSGDDCCEFKIKIHDET